MTPRIALLGWGSLLWDGGAEFDAQHEPWRSDGPLLNLEFSRISRSRGGALTPVIDADNGAPTRVAWCLARRNDPAQVIEDLRAREGSPARLIGRLCRNGPAHGRDAVACAAIHSWAAQCGLDVVVWTDLPSNFAVLRGEPFSVVAAIRYLRGLSEEKRAAALAYMHRAPEFLRTPLRTAVQREFASDITE